ncbi:MAG TPA: phosphatidylglycerol lysyltransferase domain-containing protein [Micromonosporaceae bacterium]
MRGTAVTALTASCASLGLAEVAAAVPTGVPTAHAGLAARVVAAPAHFATLVTGFHGDRVHALLGGAALVVLARGLAARRVVAYWLLVTVVTIALLDAYPRHPMRFAGALAVLALCGYVRSCFPARPDPGQLRRAAVVGVVVLVTVAVTGVWLVATSREPTADVERSVLSGLLVTPPPPVPAGTPGDVLMLIAGAGLIVVVARVLAPALPPEPGTRAQRAVVADLAAEDPDSLAPFATRADRCYVFSPDGRAAIGYRVLFGTALAGGDPVGRAESGEQAVAEFVQHCVRHGWRPAVLAAGPGWVPVWQRHGLRGLTIGDEAILDLDTFSLATRRMRNVRQAVARSRRAGVRVGIATLDDELAAELRPVVADWLGDRRERGFSMNLDAILTPRPDCVIAVARDAAGRPVGFARVAICGGGETYTLDVAPRRRDAPNGVVERLIVETARYARDRGASEMSLNFAGLRTIFESPRLAARTAAVLLRVLDPWIEVRSLYRFTAKFRPAWRPRYLLLTSWWAIAWVGAAALYAELGRPAATGTRRPLSPIAGRPARGVLGGHPRQ